MRQGDIQAFSKIFYTHFLTIKDFVDWIIGDQMDAEQIALDCFSKLWEEREKIENYNHLNGFLKLTARNAAIDYLRKNKVRNSRQQEYILMNIDRPDLKNDLELEFTHAENLEVAYVIIKSCPEDQQEAYRLFVLEGLSANEIAEIMNITPRQVYRLKDAVLDKLRDHFGNQPDGFIF